MENSPCPLHFVIALPAEARPLRRTLGLEREQRELEPPLYLGKGIRLVLSGPGGAGMMQAVGRLARLPRAERAIWVNLGIAGHPDLARGTLVRATAAVSANERLSLNSGHLSGLPGAPLFTLQRPDFDYRHPGLVDLEGFGFVQAVYQQQEQADVLVLKVVSDNRLTQPGSITGKGVERLIGDCLPRLLPPLLQTARALE